MSTLESVATPTSARLTSSSLLTTTTITLRPALSRVWQSACRLIDETGVGQCDGDLICSHAYDSHRNDAADCVLVKTLGFCSIW